MIKGPRKLTGKESKTYEVMFAPKVPANYTDIIRAKILGTYVVDMKVFGSSKEISVNTSKI